MPQRSLTLVNKLGLHARAAAVFVKKAAAFDCEVSVAHNGKNVSGKSIMGMMMLAAARGSTIDVHTSGPEAEAALDELDALVRDRFGEDE